MVNQRSRELLMCALLLTVSILALPSFAAGKRWSSKGQPGADVTALGMSRSNASLLYVGAYGGGILRSLDAGESWQAINAGTFGEWSAPVNVGPPINTIYNDNYAVLSRDELTMYFTSDRPGSLGGDDLWFATRESVDSPWREPQNMGALINGPYTDSLPFLSSNEHVLYFYSTRPAGSCGAPGPGDIWMTRRRNKHSDWEEPINLGCVLNTSADEIAPALFEDPETEQAWLFYGSNRPGSADYDVYASPLGEDGLAGPGILVPEFSSPGRDTRIFIRKDGLEAFITSNRAGGQGGIDIWTSTRQTVSDAWSVPTNLGIPVDSSSNDGSPWLSKDGTTLYFFSDRPGSLGKRDIWYTTRVKLND